MFDGYCGSEFQVCFVEWGQNNPEKTVSNLLLQLHDQNDWLMHISCSNHYYDIHDFVEQMNLQCPSIRLSGGIAGDILNRDIVGYVFNESRVIEKGIMYVYLIV